VKSPRVCEIVHLHGVVDDQLGRLEGVDLRGSPANFLMASRMAAKSTTAGTPVKSCMSTRLGVKAISRLGSAFGCQWARASMSSDRTVLPSSVRSKFSNRILSE